MRPRIAVTGLGAISSLGTGVRAVLDAMRAGDDGLSEMERDDIRALHPVRYAGWLRERWARGETKPALATWASIAAREAWDDARAEEAGVPPERIAITVGTTIGDDGSITSIADAIAEATGARGPRWTISTACASGANAIGLGRDLLLAGDADLVIAGGAEKLIPGMFAGFAALGVISHEKCAPFGEAVGTTLGEGAGFVILERESTRRSHGYLLGHALSSDAWHETSPDPRGDGIALATIACLRDAGVEAREVDYVNAHATGTAANDESEWRGVQRALGARAAQIPISGSKGFFGHAQGAAGALEAIATIACMNEGLVPPSLRIGKGRLRGPEDTVSEGRARTGSIAVALSNSAAFGGANAVLALARSPRDREGVTRAICIEGVGVMSTASGAPRDEAAVARECGDADLRSSDPSARYAIAATARAFADAGLRIPNGAQRDRTGIFGGGDRAPAESVEDFKKSLDRGLDRASAPAFARTVGHAPVAAASRVFGLRGPLTMISGRGVSGLLAIACAARWLRERDDADRIIAGGLDERELATLDEEGAAFVLVAAGSRGPRIAGVATSCSIDLAIARALEEAGLDRADIEAWTRPAHGAASFQSSMACVNAVRAIREGARTAVASAEGPQGAVALVLSGGDT